MHVFGILAQVEDGGFHVPGGPGEWLVWLAFAAVVGSLWWVLRRTRRRAQDEFFARKRGEQEESRRRRG